jgi:hypothetical protein
VSDQRAALDTFVQAVQGLADERAAGPTPEQQALSALHTWLHSPGGDGDLIDACQDWHETLADEVCNRLEQEHCDRPATYGCPDVERVGTVPSGVPIFQRVVKQ